MGAGEQQFFDPAYSRRELIQSAAWLLHALPDEALGRMREQHNGRGLVTVWRLSLRRRFERRERQAVRYA